MTGTGKSAGHGEAISPPRSTLQRRRLAIAIATIVHEYGIAEASATQVSDRAGVVHESFYESFADENDCIEFACEHSRRHLFDPVKTAYEEPGPWLERLRAAIGALLDAAVEEPLLAELYLIHSLPIRNEGKSYFYRAEIEALTEVMLGGRAAGRELERDRYLDPPAMIERFLASAIIFVVSLRIKRGEVETLLGLRDELVRLAAGFFLRLEAATSHSPSAVSESG